MFLSIFVIALAALAFFVKFDDSEEKQKPIEPVKLNDSQSIDDSKKESNDLPISDDQPFGEKKGVELNESPERKILKRIEPS